MTTAATPARSSVTLRSLLQLYGLLISFVLSCPVLALLSDRFLTTQNLINVLRVSSYYQQIIKGVVIILAVMLDLATKRRR